MFFGRGNFHIPINRTVISYLSGTLFYTVNLITIGYINIIDLLLILVLFVITWFIIKRITSSSGTLSLGIQAFTSNYQLHNNKTWIRFQKKEESSWPSKPLKITKILIIRWLYRSTKYPKAYYITE